MIMAKQTTMISAAYCSRELCAELERKGIEAHHVMAFVKGGSWYRKYTQDVVCRWLRQERGYYISLRPRISEGRVVIRAEVEYMSKHGSFVTAVSIERQSYEEACEQAIQYCVENLI